MRGKDLELLLTHCGQLRGAETSLGSKLFIYYEGIFKYLMVLMKVMPVYSLSNDF